MKVLLFGSTGYIGHEFERQLADRGIGSYPMSAVDAKMDEIDRFIVSFKIDTIINCAGYTGKPNVDTCELEKSETLSGNVVFPRILATVCERRNLTLGHVSSGCIYNGYKVGGFTEEDEPNFSFKHQPCSFYSGTKALGEEMLSELPKKYIWRLRIPFEEKNNERNYISKLLKYNTLLNAKNSLSNKKEYVKVCLDSLQKEVPFGIYNITNKGHVTTTEVVELIKKHLKIDKEFQYFESLETFNSIVKAPRSNTILNTDKLEKVGLKMSDVHESLEQCLTNWIW